MGILKKTTTTDNRHEGQTDSKDLQKKAILLLASPNEKQTDHNKHNPGRTLRRILATRTIQQRPPPRNNKRKNDRTKRDDRIMGWRRIRNKIRLVGLLNSHPCAPSWSLYIFRPPRATRTMVVVVVVVVVVLVFFQRLR